MNKLKNRYQSRMKKHRSLKSILLVWFILFSVIPLVFVGWYSLFKFEQALDGEVSQRLAGNGREIESILNNQYQQMAELSELYYRDPKIHYALTTLDQQSLKDITTAALNRSETSAISFYDKTGRLVASIFKDDKNQIRIFGLNNEKVLLNEKYLMSLKDKKNIAFVNQGKSNVSLMYFSKINNSMGRLIGYLEQSIIVQQSFLNRIKAKLKIELFVVDENQNVSEGTKNELKKINLTKESFSKDKFISVNIDNLSYGFIVYPTYWDKSKLYLGLGAVKKDSQAILKNVNIAFITVISIVSVFLIITIIFTANWFLEPIDKLIRGFKSFEKNEQLIQLPISNRTEMGLLTESFNEMSYKVFQARNDLKKKIKELENTNSELKEAQTKLVHSAKMTSLGQLVAGVAHELNNPIGFIFSNMTHLKEYADNLFELIDSIQPDDVQFKNKKNTIDYDFIKKDLPRLIKSCQDGAQRTRDIVLGLRNFSRLEEAQLKEIDIQESIDTTLEILKGEIKNRVVINKNYEPVPKIFCFASQINQVVMNILSNALQAIQGNGQIWITILPIKPIAGQVGKVQISIQDSGVGMEPQVLEKIFEPFFTTKGVGQGTGLGLSISYGIIQNHGGEIQVRSQKGIGTEFVVIIPVEPPKEKA